MKWMIPLLPTLKCIPWSIQGGIFLVSSGLIEVLLKRVYRTVPDIYAEKLIKEKLVNEQECIDIEGELNEWLSEELKLSESWKPQVSFGTVQIYYTYIMKPIIFL